MTDDGIGASGPAAGAAELRLAGQRILVIEDDFTIAEMVCQFLVTEGAVVSGPIGRLGEALEFISRGEEAFDVAVLDVGLHGEKTYPIADLLEEFGIPFIFVTGYGSEMLDARFRGHRRCEKPFRRGELIAALTAPNG